MEKKFKSKSLFTLMASLLLFSFSLSACNNSMPNQPNTPSEDSQNNDDEQPVVPDDPTPQTDPDPEPEPQPQEKYYTIVWLNYDNSLLYKDDKVVEGTTPIYKGETPTKPSTETSHFVFQDWYPSVIPAYYNTTYIAQFTEILDVYEITWKNYDGSVLKVGTYEYGDTPVYDGKTPTKESNAQYEYVFNGWSPTIEQVTQNATYIAQFDEMLRSYTITWKSENNILATETYNYGDIPTFKGDVPQKEGTAQYHWVFQGWSPEIHQVTGDVIYSASFEMGLNTFTVKWLNYDGSILEIDNDILYGTTPYYNGQTPTREKDAQHSYTFKGWSPSVTNVTQNITYFAEYTSTLNTYTITWKNDDDSIYKTDTYVYGSTPSPEYKPTSLISTPPSETTFKDFVGWSPDIETVTEDATYTAVFNDVNINTRLIFEKYDDYCLVSGFNEVNDGVKKTITIPSTFDGLPVTGIKKKAFQDCGLIKSVIIPSSVTTIESFAFYNCRSLVSVEVPNGVTSVGSYAFACCNSLISLNLPSSVVSIGESAFANCSSLTSITLPFIGGRPFDKLEYDGRYANDQMLGYVFGYDTGGNILRNVDFIPTSLKEITICEGCTSLPPCAFAYCISVLSIYIPSTVTYIGNSAFHDCKSIESVFYTGTEAEWNTIYANSFNYVILNATLYYYSETEPTESGNYWHYVDGVPTVW